MNFKVVKNSFIFQTLEQFYRDTLSHKVREEKQILGIFYI
jgi:hypothetical protein